MSNQNTRDWQPTYLTSWSPCSPTVNRSRSPSQIYEYTDYNLYKDYYDAGYLPNDCREINPYPQARRPCIASKVVSPRACGTNATYSLSKRTSPYVQERYTINTNQECLPNRVSCRTYAKCSPRPSKVVPYPYESERYFCRSPPRSSRGWDGPRCFQERLLPADFTHEAERDIRARDRNKSVSVPIQKTYENQPYASFIGQPQESFLVPKKSSLAHSRSHHEIQVRTSDVILQTGSCSRCRVARQPSPYLLIPINASETSLKCAGCLARETVADENASDDDSEVWIRCLGACCERGSYRSRSGRCPGPIIVPCFRYEDGGYVQRLPGSIFKRNGLQDVEFNSKGVAKYIRSDALAYYNCDMM